MRQRQPRRPIPHALLFGKRLRLLRDDRHIAHLLKQNLELKALVRAMADRLFPGRPPREVRRLVQEILVEQRRIYNEALSLHAVRRAQSVAELLAMLAEIDEVDRRR